MYETALKEILKSAIDIGKKSIGEYVKSLNNKKNKKISSRESDSDSVRKKKSAALSVKISASAHLNHEDSYSNLISHSQHCDDWSSQVALKDMIKPKKFKDIYIELDTYLVPTRLRLHSREPLSRESAENLMKNTSQHTIINGTPGAGKTTTLKKLVRYFFDEQSVGSVRDYVCPIVIRFRDIDTSTSRNNYIQYEISKIFKVTISTRIPVGLDEFYSNIKGDVEIEESVASLKILDELRPIIFLDGYDEISSLEAKRSIEKELSHIGRKLKRCRLIITTRTGELNAPADLFAEFEISPLSSEQIDFFASRWIKNVSEKTQFLDAIRKSPFHDTAIKPLSLAHLCAIYERSKTIPNKPRLVYRKVVWLLLEEWDEQREIVRESQYLNFGIDEKYNFLCALAFYFSVKLQKYTMTKSEISEAFRYLRWDANLDPGEESVIYSEIESQTGLFIQVSSSEYEFAHKSLHEFLAAEHIVKMPKVPDRNDAIGIASELAISVAISSSPTSYLEALVSDCFANNSQLSPYFYTGFLNRLIGEKPNFEETERTMYSLLCIITLCLCRGVVPSRSKLGKVEKLTVLNDREMVGVPFISKFFDPPKWEILREPIVSNSRFVEVTSDDGKISGFYVPYFEKEKRYVLKNRHHLLVPARYLSE